MIPAGSSLTAVTCRSCRDKAARESEEGASGSSYTAVGASAMDSLGMSGTGTSSEWLEGLREMIDARCEATSHASSVSTSSSRLANVRYKSVSSPYGNCDLHREDTRIQDDVFPVVVEYIYNGRHVNKVY